MNVNEVAKLLGVHTNTIYNYINTGKIKAVKKGGSWEISEDEFLKIKRMQTRTPRMIIDSLTLVLDLIEGEIKHVDVMLDSWKGSKTLEYIKRRDELESTQKQLERLRSDYQLMVRTMLLEMDEHIDPTLNTNDIFKFRHIEKGDKE